ncbi:MAG: hypothetical protein ACTIKT_10055 [Microbacterium sp.]
MPTYGSPVSQRFTDELDHYASRGIQSSIVFHGSDARDPQLALSLNPESYFRDADPVWTEKLGAIASWNRQSAEDSGVPIFVTTPDMLDHVPGARLLPITIEVDNWVLREQPFVRKIPRVLHSPSSTVTKGSRHIMPVLEDFERSGRIEIVRSGRVPHRQMKSLYTGADIVVDSIQVGTYAVTSLEAMAGGRLTIAHVGEAARARMGGDLPIVEATPATFRSVLEQVVEERDRSVNIAQRGPDYVRRWHDGGAAAQVLAGFLGVQN